MKFLCLVLTKLAIYVNLAIEVKLYQDVFATGVGVKDARHRFLKFYNKMPLHADFQDVEKSEFKELFSRYRNARKTSKQDDDNVLKECYTSIGAPPPKRQRTDSSRRSDTVRLNDDDSDQEDDDDEEGDEEDG